MCLLLVMAGLVPPIHVLGEQDKGRRGCPGHRRAEATPSFGRLCPDMTAMWKSPATHRRHHHLVTLAGAAVDFIAGAELEILAHADTHFAQPGPIAGDRNRRVREAAIDLDEGVFDL